MNPSISFVIRFTTQVVLYRDIVEVFDLPDDNRSVIILDDLINSCLIGTTLLHHFFQVSAT
ncbi:hypothetical protein [Nitrosomonas mobilis]|uniref:hypothetical protein n=1 Tax=Nitrosomonas mobilis TaxID=51642 RepID=UPI001C409E3F|nr:hypothetical protein [Nitrosomonas mobilis]